MPSSTGLLSEFGITFFGITQLVPNSVQNWQAVHFVHTKCIFACWEYLPNPQNQSEI